MKTVKQLADELNISKQKLYRYIKKNHISDVHHDAGVMYIDDALESTIKSAFEQSEAHHEAHHEAHQNHINDAVFDALLKQLEEKDKQINELNQRLAESNKLLDQEQQLNGNNQKRLEELTANNQALIGMSTFEFMKFKRKTKKEQE